LDEIADRIAQDRPMAAQRVVERIHESISHLEDHPLIGRQGRVPGTRELVVPRTSVIVPYRLQGETIELLHVFHTARRWPSRF
jgi:plasmid stabilization system protein ParE